MKYKYEIPEHALKVSLDKFYDIIKRNETLIEVYSYSPISDMYFCSEEGFTENYYLCSRQHKNCLLKEYIKRKDLIEIIKLELRLLKIDKIKK